jgi:hypothetical protein
MATTEKKKSNGSARTSKKANTAYVEPKRLSKAGLWRRNNPGGIIEVYDRRAVNR